MADYRLKLAQILREHGCRPIRNPASGHEIWYSPITNRSFPITSKVPSRHYANLVLKQAGLAKQF